MDRYSDLVERERARGHVPPGAMTTDDLSWFKIRGVGTLSKEQMRAAMVGVPTNCRRNRKMVVHRKRTTFPGIGTGGLNGIEV